MKASISQNSPRRKTWIDIFGSGSVEIISSQWQTSPQGKRCYQLDVKSLTLKQRASLTRRMSEFWKVPVDLVVERMDDPARGVWIDASDVEVTIDAGRLF